MRLSQLAPLLVTSGLAQPVHADMVATVGNWEIHTSNFTCWVQTKVPVSPEAYLMVMITNPAPVDEVSVATVPNDIGQVSIQIGERRVPFVSQGQFAWPATKDDDRAALNALMSPENSTAVVAISNAGTASIQISGFATARDFVLERCN